eukprot:scaffold26125_cov103-Isochrysis_galbana.AAC.2
MWPPKKKKMWPPKKKKMWPPKKKKMWTPKKKTMWSPKKKTMWPPKKEKMWPPKNKLPPPCLLRVQRDLPLVEDYNNIRGSRLYFGKYVIRQRDLQRRHWWGRPVRAGV